VPGKALPPSALVEHNDVELARYQCRAPGGEFGEASDASWFRTAIPAGRFNCVLRSRLAAKTADARIEELLAPYRRRGGPHGWVVGPSAAPRDLPRRLDRQGLQHLFDLRGMAADLTKASLQRKGPRGLTIERVADEAALAVWVETMSKGFNDPPEEAVAFLRMERALGVGEGEPRVHFLGRMDGEPVATSFMFADGKSAGIYNVATLSPWRGRGIGAAMTAAAMRHARDINYEVATLLSTAMGAPLYGSMGFQEAGVFGIYGVSPAAGAPPTASGRSSRTARPSKGVQRPRGSAPSARRGPRRA
jgi:GNAT superfamily N-acetyltransferase